MLDFVFSCFEGTELSSNCPSSCCNDFDFLSRSLIGSVAMTFKQKSKIKKGFEAWNYQKKEKQLIPTEIDRIEKTCTLFLTGNQKVKSTRVELKPTFYFSS